jgi:alpha-beta hydrolase superfamily lysophospholipase
VIHRESRFTGAEGFSIYWQTWQTWQPEDAPDAVLVIAHGLGEHGGRYAHVAEFMVAQGMAVYAVDHRGHGRSEGRRAKIDRFVNVTRDLDEVVEAARRENRDTPIFLLGHSMGGAIALAYAIGHQEKLQGLLLSGPALSLDALPWFVRALCQVLTVVAPNLPLFAVEPELVSRDPSVVEDYRSDPLNMHDKVPVRTLGEIIKTVQWVPRALGMLKLPMLVMHGSEDQLVPASASRMIHDRSGSVDKTLQLYPGLFHEILNELPPDREQVMQDAWNWIRERL